MWAPSMYEWGDYGGDEDARVRISAASWRKDPYAHDDDDDHDDHDDHDDDEMIVGAYEHRRDTGLRTAAEVELPASSDDTGNLPTMEPIALAAVFPR